MFLLLLHLLLAAADYPQGGGSCQTPFDCSLGGECLSGSCVCDPWWTGPQCDLLNLVAAESEQQGLAVPGYHSWGGHAVHGDDGLYHGYFSFMCRHSTLADWTSVSSIWHATSAQVEGPYALLDMVAQPWAHNAMISATLNASAPLALYQLGDSSADPSLWSPCFNASEAQQQQQQQQQQQGPAAHANSNSLYVRSAPSVHGPWTAWGNNTPLAFTFENSWASDTNGANPAPLFLPNGTVLMYFSANPCPPHWGNKVPGNNCIGVARGSSWSGPFQALPLPVTHPESEDAHVFRDKRGNFHLLTNVNNDHARCPAGVPCGGHAWGTDGLTFSNLSIGAFGPYLRFSNGSSYTAAYVERPQVTLAEDGVTPLAFFVGMGRASYYDSVTWAQRFCSGGAGEVCGPMLPPPPPPLTPVAFSLPRQPGLCLGSNATGFPCPGGWGNTCPLFLVPCASPAAAWLQRADGLLESALWRGSCLNRDCNSCSSGTQLKLAQCAGDGAPVAYAGAGGGQLLLGGCASSCLSDGTGPHTPVCKAGEQTAAGQLTVMQCSQAATQGWVRQQHTAELHSAKA